MTLSPISHSLSGPGDIARALSSSFGNAARSSVRAVTIRSRLSPEARFTGSEVFGPGTLISPDTGLPSAPGEFGVPSLPRPFEFSEAILRFAKPEIEIDTAVGRFSVAPYGRPEANYFWPVVIVGGAALGALAVLAVRGLRR